MLATPHLLAGAAIGKTLRRPWLAWPVAFASHFLLDFTPHLDSHALFGVPTVSSTMSRRPSGRSASGRSSRLWQSAWR